MTLDFPGASPALEGLGGLGFQGSGYGSLPKLGGGPFVRVLIVRALLFRTWRRGPAWPPDPLR